MSSILVVAAVRQELKDFCRLRQPSMTVLLTGMGQSKAFEVVRKHLQSKAFRLVVSAGFAGATRPGFRVGDLVAASKVIDASTGRWLAPGNGAPSNGSSITSGTVLTCARPLVKPEEKLRAGVDYGAVAVDMETYGVARAAQEAGVPWLSLRAILDPAEEILPVGSFRQGFKLLANPLRWKVLSNFLAAMEKASRSLAVGLAVSLADK